MTERFIMARVQKEPDNVTAQKSLTSKDDTSQKAHCLADTVDGAGTSDCMLETAPCTQLQCCYLHTWFPIHITWPESGRHGMGAGCPYSMTHLGELKVKPIRTLDLVLNL